MSTKARMACESMQLAKDGDTDRRMSHLRVFFVPLEKSVAREIEINHDDYSIFRNKLIAKSRTILLESIRFNFVFDWIETEGLF